MRREEKRREEKRRDIVFLPCSAGSETCQRCEKRRVEKRRVEKRRVEKRRKEKRREEKRKKKRDLIYLETPGHLILGYWCPSQDLDSYMDLARQPRVTWC